MYRGRRIKASPARPRPYNAFSSTWIDPERDRTPEEVSSERLLPSSTRAQRDKAYEDTKVFRSSRQDAPLYLEPSKQDQDDILLFHAQALLDLSVPRTFIEDPQLRNAGRQHASSTYLHNPNLPYDARAHPEGGTSQLEVCAGCQQYKRYEAALRSASNDKSRYEGRTTPKTVVPGKRVHGAAISVDFLARDGPSAGVNLFDLLCFKDVLVGPHDPVIPATVLGEIVIELAIQVDGGQPLTGKYSIVANCIHRMQTRHQLARNVANAYQDFLQRLSERGLVSRRSVRTYQLVQVYTRDMNTWKTVCSQVTVESLR